MIGALLERVHDIAVAIVNRVGVPLLLAGSRCIVAIDITGLIDLVLTSALVVFAAIWRAGDICLVARAAVLVCSVIYWLLSHSYRFNRHLSNILTVFCRFKVPRSLPFATFAAAIRIPVGSTARLLLLDRRKLGHRAGLQMMVLPRGLLFGDGHHVFAGRLRQHNDARQCRGGPAAASQVRSAARALHLVARAHVLGAVFLRVLRLEQAHVTVPLVLRLVVGVEKAVLVVHVSAAVRAPVQVRRRRRDHGSVAARTVASGPVVLACRFVRAHCQQAGPVVSASGLEQRGLR